MANEIQNEADKQVGVTNIAWIKTLLTRALQAVTEADQAAQQQEQNLAIGCLIDVGPMLANASALFDATLYMHSPR